MLKESDKYLFEKIKSGDKKALEVLFDRYYEPLCDFSYQFLKSTDLSEEAVSDIFIKLWLNKKNISFTTNLKSYLYRAVRNCSLNYIKKENGNFEALSTISHQIGSKEQSADYPLIFDEFQKDVASIIDQLPDQQRLIFRMNRLEGLKYKEIAEILNISVHTVQNHMVEAVKVLSKKHTYFQSLKAWFIFALVFFYI
ncbi:MAG: RNA polymerase sigma-70 factor [Bacteroidota bacterium]